MNAATLTITALPDDPTVKAVVLDCEHATTTCYLASPPGERLADDVLIAVVLAQHLTEEPDCRCCDELIRRYGLLAVQ